MVILNKLNAIIVNAKEEIYVFWLSLAFCFSLIINPNNKTLVLFFAIYTYLLYIKSRDFKKSLLLSFLASLPIKVGKFYELDLISIWELNIQNRLSGITNFITISIKEIIISIIFLVLIKEILNKKNRFKLDSIFILLFIYFVSLVISSIVGSLIPDISLVYSLFYIEPLIIYVFIKNYIKNGKNIILVSLMVISAFLIFQSFLATMQFIKQGTLGTSIETSNNVPLSMGADEDTFFTRSIGTFYHANELAHFVLLFTFIFIPVIFTSINKRVDKIFVFTLIACLLVLALSLSRSAWISFFISFLLLIFIIEKRWKLKLQIRKNVKKYLLALSVITLPILWFFIMPRITNILFSFEQYGGSYTRVELIKESIETIKENPFFGIGLGMDIFYSYQRAITTIVDNQKNVLLYFPESVHNGYLLLLSQTGIVSSLIYITICYLLIKKIFNTLSNQKIFKRKFIMLSLGIGCVSIFVNNIFQAFIPDLQILIFMSIIFSNKKWFTEFFRND